MMKHIKFDMDHVILMSEIQYFIFKRKNKILINDNRFNNEDKMGPKQKLPDGRKRQK